MDTPSNAREHQADAVSSTDRTFLETLRSWLEMTHEILLLIRYSRAAGNKSFEFFSSFETLVETLHKLPSQTSIIAFRLQQLPIRGIVDDEFIRKCLDYIPDGSEFLVVETVERSAGRAKWFHHSAGESHAELQDALERSRGKAVAAGEYPPWLQEAPDVISAIVPSRYGIVEPGIY